MCECPKGTKYSEAINFCIECLYFEGECYEKCPNDTVEDLDNMLCIKKAKSVI